MLIQGDPLAAVEYGNAWSLRDPDLPHSNWIVGSSPAIAVDSLRHMSQLSGHNTSQAEQLCVKWFQHHPDDPPEWGLDKPISSGRTLSVLTAPGRFSYRFGQAGRALQVVLEQPGEFVIWGEGVDHSWAVLEPSTIVTVRWLPVLRSPQPGGTPRPPD